MSISPMSSLGSQAAAMVWFEEAKKLGCRDRHRKLDLAIVKLICCSGIPSYISDLDVWNGLFVYADSSYRPSSRAQLEEVDIIGEAESTDEIQLAYLRTQQNITVSCDGGTTQGREAFWTLHMSRERRREANEIHNLPGGPPCFSLVCPYQKVIVVQLNQRETVEVLAL
jgi:hypothetical protein